MRMLAADADEVAIRCLLTLRRWDDARRLADRQIEFCRESGYASLLWRLAQNQIAYDGRVSWPKRQA